MESQNKRIREYLESGKTIMDFDAQYMFSCRRLGARIFDIKEMYKEEGKNWKIDAPLVPVLSEGKIKHVARYKLIRS